MTDTPITDPHAAFARALVALAREHGCGSLKVDFSLSSSSFFRSGLADHTTVRMWWSEGRHGIANTIAMRAEASVAITEKVPADGLEKPQIMPLEPSHG